jgi:hypothetical protein
MWDIILAERAKRTIILTTHFLDEGDVLADHIVILSRGQIKCQGTGAELKVQFGGGYRVHLPRTGSANALDLPSDVHQDRVIYRSKDSSSAAKLVAQLEAAGHKEVQMAGPTIEDVFLSVTNEDLSSDGEGVLQKATNGSAWEQLSTGRRTPFWSQVATLLRKRLTILPRYWMSNLLALVLPIVCIPAIQSFVSPDMRSEGRPKCSANSVMRNWEYPLELYSYSYDQPGMPVGPMSASDSLHTVLRDFPVGAGQFDISQYDQQISIVDDIESFQLYIDNNSRTLYSGGLYMGDSVAAPLLKTFGGISYKALLLLDLWSQMRSLEPIAVFTGSMNARFYTVC